MIPFISNTFHALNIRLGNYPTPNMHHNSVEKTKVKHNTEIVNPEIVNPEIVNPEILHHLKRVNEIDEYFITCFDKNNNPIESQRCQLLKENYDNFLIEFAFN